MDLNKVAETVLELSGGTGNISSITHCSTRLRFFIRDKSKVDTATIEKTKPVLGVVFNGDELQIILGKNLIPVYSEATRLYNESGGGGSAADAPKKEEKLTPKAALDKVVGFVSASVTPLIPGLVAGGMLKVFLLLGTLAYEPFKSSQAYELLSMAANIPFYFMPVFVAYGAAKKLGATPLYAMSVAGALVYPDFVKLLKSGTDVSMFGLPVSVVSYSSTLLPALLISLFAYHCEKFLVKIVPGILKSVFVGMLTIGISFTLGITIFGPFGDMVGAKIVHVFVFASEYFAPIAIALLAGCMPWLVMTGMHHAVTPFMVQAFANPGYDFFFRPSYILHNMAEGGACLGVGLRAKNKTLKGECFSLAFGCIVAGVTEPAIYGVNFRLKKPMFGVMSGAAAGGIVAGLFGATAYVYGYSTILALPIFQETILAMAAAVGVAIIVAAIVTFFLGFDYSLIVEPEEEPANSVTTAKSVDIPSTEKSTLTELKAYATGETIALADVNDGVFSAKMLGDGLATIPDKGEVISPANSTVCSVAASKHAIGLQLDNGVQLLIHIGIDTVNMNGKGFTVHVNEGQQVKAGDKLVSFDRDEIKKAGYKDTIMLIAVENIQDLPLNLQQYGKVTAGTDTIIKFE